MNLPENTQVYDNGLAHLWWDESGILCSLSKKNVRLTKETLQKAFEVIENLSGGKKVCMIADMSLTGVPDKKETYDYAIEEMIKTVKAHAMIASTPLSKMIANLYLHLKKPPYPAKIFTDEAEAKEWLKQYL